MIKTFSKGLFIFLVLVYNRYTSGGEKMKKHKDTIILIVLSIILVFVGFYTLFVHVPYYEYHNNLTAIKNHIIETNHYSYLDYFNEHKGKEVYYILKVVKSGYPTYVAYDESMTLVDEYQGNVASLSTVKAAILEKYKDSLKEDDLETIEVGYENNKFVYCTKVLEEDSILYIYYDLDDGEFLKAYHLKKNY